MNKEGQKKECRRSFQRNVGSHADVSARISVRALSLLYALVFIYETYVPENLGMDIYVYVYPCVYLDGDVAVSLDWNCGNEPKKLGMKGYSRDMKT